MPWAYLEQERLKSIVHSRWSWSWGICSYCPVLMAWFYEQESKMVYFSSKTCHCKYSLYNRLTSWKLHPYELLYWTHPHTLSFPEAVPRRNFLCGKFLAFIDFNLLGLSMATFGFYFKPVPTRFPVMLLPVSEVNVGWIHNYNFMTVLILIFL